MDRELTPDDIESLLPSYALDAVDDNERAAIDAYLAHDPAAREELAELQRTASLLGHTGGPAPAAVWEKLELAIANVPKRDAPPAPVVPITSAPSSKGASARRPNRAVWIAAVAAALALIVVGVVVVADSAGENTPTEQAALASAARAAQTAPGARHAVLADANGKKLATAVVLPDGSGYLTVAAMPKLSRAETYQLWGLTKEHTISLGVMGSNPSVVAFNAAGRPLGLAITTEAAGGVAVSEQAPDAVGNFA